MADRDDDDRYAPGRNLLWVRPDDVDENEEFVEPLPLPAYLPPEEADPQRYVQALLRQPLFGEPAGSTDVPDLRSAGREKLKSAGLHGDTVTPVLFEPTPASAADASADRRPRSWKLPARMLPGTAENFDNDSASKEAGEHALANASELDLAVGIAIGLSIEPTRRHGFRALGAGVPLTVQRVPRISRRGGTIPQDIDREGTDRFLRQLNIALRGSGYEVRVQQYETVL